VLAKLTTNLWEVKIHRNRPIDWPMSERGLYQNQELTLFTRSVWPIYRSIRICIPVTDDYGFAVTRRLRTHRPLIGVVKVDLDDDLKLSPPRLRDLVRRSCDHCVGNKNQPQAFIYYMLYILCIIYSYKMTQEHNSRINKYW
jgi:hypothetical protein